MDDHKRCEEQRYQDRHEAIDLKEGLITVSGFGIELSYRAMRNKLVNFHCDAERNAGTHVKTLFKVKSVNAVMGPTQVPVPLPFGSSELTKVWLAQKPPIARSDSFVRKYPQHWNYK